MGKALLSLGLLVATGCATPGGTSSKVTISSLPDFELTSIDGEPVRLSDYLGKQVVVLSFWDTFCEPCKAELPPLNRMYAAHKGDGLVLLSIAMDGPATVAQVTPYVKRIGLTFPVLLDANTQAANLYNVHKLAPFTVVIDSSGKIETATAGYEPGSEIALEEEIERLLRHPKNR